MASVTWSLIHNALKFGLLQHRDLSALGGDQRLACQTLQLARGRPSARRMLGHNAARQLGMGGVLLPAFGIIQARGAATGVLFRVKARYSQQRGQFRHARGEGRNTEGAEAAPAVHPSVAQFGPQGSLRCALALRFLSGALAE